MDITNKKIVALLKEKDTLVSQGRSVSSQIDKIEKKIKDLEEKEKAITEKVQPKELGEKAEALKKEINEKIAEFEKIASEITKTKLDAIPKAIEKKHKDLLADKEKLEQDRNKLAIKVQKVKDRVVPLLHKEIKPHLKEYEDLETATLKGEIVKVKIFSHLEEFKAQYAKKNK